MALFKIFKGPENDLSKVPITEGYAYVTQDKGNFYVDISPDKRIQINAGSAIKLDDGVTALEIDDIFTTSDLLPVANGGTGLTTLTLNGILVGNGTDAVKLIPTKSGAFYAEGTNAEPKFGALPIAQGGTGGTSAEQARANLAVYSTSDVDNRVDEVTTQAYTTTLTVDGWVASDNMFYQDWNNVSLSCGKNHDVPPMVTYSTNKEEYAKIDSDKSEATPQRGIRFWIPERPTNSIGLIIVDNK